MLQRYGGVVLCDLGDGGSPKLRHLEDVGLVDRGNFLATLACEFEGHAGDAYDFVASVSHGVDGLVTLAIPPAWGAEVESTEELTHEEDIDIFGDFGT